MKIRLVKIGTMKPSKPFKSLEEEANFWDTHDAVDVFGKDIKVGFHQSLKSDTLTIRFQPEHIQILKEKALLLGIGPTTLARMWIMEKLKSLVGKSKQSQVSSQAVLHKINKPKKLY